MAELDGFFRVFFFILGTTIGSFLNVCIVRLPLNRSVAFPGSHCFQCGKPVRWFDNIPLISYLLLRGKCRDCGAGFSCRYFFIELLTGLSFLGFYLFFGLDSLLVPYLILLGGLIVATFIDFEHRIIPDQLSLYGIPLALILSFVLPRMHLERGMPSFVTGDTTALILVVICFLLMWVEVVRRKAHLTREDIYLFAGAFVVIALARSLHSFASAVPVLESRMLSLSAALQGGLIGGASLYLMGMFGALLIQKRVVTPIDLREVSDHSEDLFKLLIKAGYLNDAGEITAKFTALKGADGLALELAPSVSRQKVYDMIMSCQEGGVMGGGDVKLMALVGAFIGWKLALITIVLAPFFGAPVGIVEKIRTKSSAIAFGPYLVMGAIVALLWGERIMGWFLSNYGIY